MNRSRFQSSDVLKVKDFNELAPRQRVFFDSPFLFSVAWQRQLFALQESALELWRPNARTFSSNLAALVQEIVHSWTKFDNGRATNKYSFDL